MGFAVHMMYSLLTTASTSPWRRVVVCDLGLRNDANNFCSLDFFSLRETFSTEVPTRTNMSSRGFHTVYVLIHVMGKARPSKNTDSLKK